LTETHTPDGAIWRYTYDAFGRRIKKECVKAGNSGKKSNVSYLWQGATLAEEHRATGETTEVTRWHFEPGTFIPLAKEAISAAGKVSFYPIVTDHLGTPKELFDTDGNCVWQAEHTLWGETTIPWQKMKKPDGLQPLVDCNLRFQNQWEDDETGLFYNLNRYYDPDSGQYLSSDPIGLDGGLRTHGYVHDPMQWVDPLGLAGCPKGSGESRIPARFKKDLKGGGSWLMTEEQYLAYAKGRRMVGRPDGQFMTSAKNMNKLINKTGGDPVQLGQKLGIDNWTSNTKLIRMDVVDPLNYNPRMPSASMNGSNNLFKPGGLTSGGVPEIATDLLPSSQVWATPIN
jgi:RHS repeat-associated protein